MKCVPNGTTPCAQDKRLCPLDSGTYTFTDPYLFCDPAQFSLFYPNHEREIKNLKLIADAVDTPEAINDGPVTAPSKRIIAQLPGYSGAKSTEGPQVAELIGLQSIRSKCPHFEAWLTRLEQLGEESENSDAEKL